MLESVFRNRLKLGWKDLERVCGCKNDFVINCRYKLKFCQVSNIAVLFICCVKFKIDVLEKSSENKNRQSQTTFLTGGMLVIAGF